jgi:hypothetical protein
LGKNRFRSPFPLYRSSCCSFDWKRRQPQIAVGKEFVREKNEHMAVNAERWVIANIRSKNIEDLVKRARGTRLMPKFDRQVVSADTAKRLRARARHLEEKTDSH